MTFTIPKIVFFSILLALGVREVTFSSFFQKENMMILCFLIMVSLVQPLEDNYELEDHRNDPAYEAWNQLAEQYEQNLAKIRGEIEVAKETGVEK